MNQTPQNADPFFVLGGIKCGTTFLYHCLRQHPDVCFSRPKEPDFFMDDREYEKGTGYYFEQYFSHYDGEAVFGDARTNNLYLPWVPPRLRDEFEDARLVVVVRDPVDRAYSDYQHARRHATEPESFPRALMLDHARIKEGRRLMTRSERKTYQEQYRRNQGWYYRMYLDGGYYAEMIARYHRHFEPDALRVLKFENLIESPLETCNRVFRFLDLEPLEELGEEDLGTNPGRVPRSYILQRLYSTLGELSVSDYVPTALKNTLARLNLRRKSSQKSMDEFTRLWLAEHYWPHNERLREFVPFSLEDWTTPGDVLAEQGSPANDPSR